MAGGISVVCMNAHLEGVMAAHEATDRAASDSPEEQLFAAKAFGDLAGFMNVCMCVLGDRLGLFKALAAHGPATSGEFATHAHIHERYAREWLSQMACAAYLRYDPVTHRFSLPEAHFAVLAAEGDPNFLGGVYQNVQSLEQGLFSQLLQAFRSGGGVPYSAYDANYWEGLERASATLYSHTLVHTYLPALPDAHAALASGVSVADIGCGRGSALIALAQAFPQSQFVGYDAFEPNIVQAQAKAEAAGVAERVRFVQHSASEDLPEQYELAFSFDSLHHAPDVLAMLRSIRQSLRPNGMYICSEPPCALPLEENIGMGGAMLYASSVMACVPQVLSEAKEALGAAGLPEATLRELCYQAGFSTLRLVPIEKSPTNVYEMRV
jgi:2-polyprenyl-3-methyl-5-hydroxy-6-metoxy-1,4-benzoquinol methylase